MRAIVGFICVLIAGACSKVPESSHLVNQKRIYQSYSVTYDEGDNKTRVEAEFRWEAPQGNVLELTRGSLVEHSLYPLSRSQTGASSYQGEGSGFKGNHVFRFRDSQNHVYVNKANLRIASFRGLPPVLSKKTGAWISWTGPAISKEPDAVTVSVQDSSEKAPYMFSTRVPGATRIFLPKEKLATLADGAATIVLTRETLTKVAEGSEVGGRMYTRYRTLARPVQIH